MRLYLSILGPFFFATTVMYIGDALKAPQRDWEAANHCAVIGHTDTAPYQTNPRRAVLGCDCGYSLRPTE